MGRLVKAARRVAAVATAAVGVLAVSSCGSSAPATFRITEMKHATAVYVNGPKEALTIWWTGNPTFPVTWSDFTGAVHVSNDATNPLVWPDATYYVASNPDSSAPAQT